MQRNAYVSNRIYTVLLGCGVIGPLLKVGTDILAGTIWDGYKFTSRSISDLSAIGAPTRSLVVPLDITANVLLIAFALGVWRSAVGNRWLRVTAVMILGNAAFLFIGSFFPFHLGEAISTFPNTMNTIVIGMSVLFLLLSIGFGAAAQRNWFRLFSIGIFLIFLAGDIWATRHTPFVLAGQRGPLVGVQERSMLYSYLLWVLVLAVFLLRKERRSTHSATRAHEDVAEKDAQGQPQ
jgi:hypothetical protein